MRHYIQRAALRRDGPRLREIAETGETPSLGNGLPGLKRQAKHLAHNDERMMHMEIKLRTFEFDGSRLRTYEEGGKVWFVACDAAKMLGYAKPANAIKAHCRYTLKRGIPHPQSSNLKLEVNVIPEGDLYRLIAHSELPVAEKFESWVFDEVLPAIRRTGSYGDAARPQGRLRVFHNEDFGSVRVGILEGKPWFFAEDIRDFLVVEDFAQVMMQRVARNDRSAWVLEGKTFPVVSETGVYNLLPYARRRKIGNDLRKWIASDVMPELRKEEEAKAMPEPPAAVTEDTETRLWAAIAVARAKLAAMGELIRIYSNRTPQRAKKGLECALEETAEELLEHVRSMAKETDTE